MAQFVTTTGTTAAIEDIINTADSKLVLISPYIKIAGRLFQNLVAADQRGVTTRIVYGKKKQLDTDVEKQLRQLRHVEVSFLDNLHANYYLLHSSLPSLKQILKQGDSLVVSLRSFPRYSSFLFHMTVFGSGSHLLIPCSFRLLLARLLVLVNEPAV